MDMLSMDLGLRRQHLAFERAGHDPHRRHSGLTTMHRLVLRRSRRTWRQRLNAMTGSFFAFA